MAKTFPEPVVRLPRADVPLSGVAAYLLQGQAHQVLFMEFDEDARVPSHSHGAQWAVVVEGRIDLVVGGVPQTYSKGDSYFIPAGVEHSALVHAGYADVTFFEDRDRYRPL